jgi:hypothetical protein
MKVNDYGKKRYAGEISKNSERIGPKQDTDIIQIVSERSRVVFDMYDVIYEIDEKVLLL